MASRACGFSWRKKLSTRLIAEGRVVQNFELPVETRRQRGGEGEQALDAAGDFGGAAIAMAHHAFDPGWVGGAAAHDAGDLLDQGAHLRRVGARDVGVIERRRIAEPVGGGGEPALVGRVVEAIEQIDLGVILLMQEGVSGFDARGEAVSVSYAIEALAVGGGRGGEIIEAEIGSLRPRRRAQRAR